MSQIVEAYGQRLEFPDGMPQEQIAQAIKTNAQALRAAQRQAFIASNPGEYDPSSKEWQAKYGPKSGLSGTQKLLSNAFDGIAGLTRGAGSIGATLLAPKDMISDALDGKGLSLESNRERRKAMDWALGDMGADTDSMLYKGGKLTAEIAGTAGTGGAAANVLGRTGAVSAPALAAIRTSGFSAPGASMTTRALGGSVTGGLSAGLVNPEDAGTGALIGGALPGVVKLVGNVGQSVGRIFRGPEQAADLANAVRQAQVAGYVIPPTQAKASLGNRLLEGMAGKLTTAQNASARNQEVTNRLAARALGLGDDVKLTPEVLDDVRKQAGKAYGELASLPARPAQAANSLTNTPGLAAFKPAEAVKDLRQARNDATAWYRAYQRSASPADQEKAKAAKALATKLESQLEDYARSLRRPDLVDDMVEARKVIAKTYSVESALNATTGSVNAQKLAKQLEKGKPLSGELKQAAEFAQRFKTASKPIEDMGSLPQTSPLDWMSGIGLSTATQNPLGLLAIGARPAARAAALSGPVQRGLLQAPATQSLLGDPALLQFGYRAAPVLMADQ